MTTLTTSMVSFLDIKSSDAVESLNRDQGSVQPSTVADFCSGRRPDGDHSFFLQPFLPPATEKQQPYRNGDENDDDGLERSHVA